MYSGQLSFFRPSVFSRSLTVVLLVFLCCRFHDTQAGWCVFIMLTGCVNVQHLSIACATDTHSTSC